MTDVDTTPISIMPSVTEIQESIQAEMQPLIELQESIQAETQDAPPPTDLVPSNTSTSTTIPFDPATKTKKIIRRKRRPARPQVDPSTIKSEPPPQTGTIFNIWYNKWSGGDREDKYLSKHAATGRCNIATDSGYTRADKVTGSYFCLFFAKGLCPKGHECEYLHRLPGLHDLFNPNVDCFGRDKHSDYRDDMGGVGSFMRQNRTLYVGRIHVTDDIEEVVARHFAEWGQVDRIRVLNSRGVAFVTYTNEANSQFAKEAMAHQSLDHSEILNVRWATVDPNPLAQKREAHKIEEQAAEAVRRALPAEFVAELEGRDPEARKRKKIEGSFGLEGYEAPDEVWFARGQAAVNGSGRQMIEDGQERYLIEDAPPSQTYEGDSRGDSSGILSGSTLAALKGYSTRIEGNVFTSKESTAAPAAPLVSYDSDDTSD
ncbi:Pre-mRNA-splicing factor [Acarospora aff. strigata]|nr:Pre-mRNA-splicing factor [Acarospora aff. strigata]